MLSSKLVFTLLAAMLLVLGSTLVGGGLALLEFSAN